jgi:hypothetical protein
MKWKWVYAALCVLGTLLPYATAVPFAGLSGADWLTALRTMPANPVSAVLGADLGVTLIVFWIFVFQESRTHRIPLWWLCVLANLLVGLSLAFPLFLLLRELAKERAARPAVPVVAR